MSNAPLAGIFPDILRVAVVSLPYYGPGLDAALAWTTVR